MSYYTELIATARLRAHTYEDQALAVLADALEDRDANYIAARHRAEKAEAERDHLRAAVDAVRDVATHCDFDCGCTECMMARAVRAALDERLKEG